MSASTIAEIADGFTGGTFAPDGSIYFNDDFDTGLKRVPAGGGQAEEFTTPDRGRGEIRHSMPYVLPSGKGLVSTILKIDTGLALDDRNTARAPAQESGQVTVLLDFTSGEASTLLRDSYGPYRYLPSGQLLMIRAGRLIALPFDDHALETKGEPFKFFGDEETPVEMYALSLEGTLAHSDTNVLRNEGAVWLDRQGEETAITKEPGFYLYPSLSPDGKQLAITHQAQTWVYELDGGRRMTLTENGSGWVPLFSPDGSRVVFGAYRPEENLYWTESDGSGETELLLDADNRQYPLEAVRVKPTEPTRR